MNTVIANAIYVCDFAIIFVFACYALVLTFKTKKFGTINVTWAFTFWLLVPALIALWNMVIKLRR